MDIVVSFAQMFRWASLRSAQTCIGKAHMRRLPLLSLEARQLGFQLRDGEGWRARLRSGVGRFRAGLRALNGTLTIHVLYEHNNTSLRYTQLTTVINASSSIRRTCNGRPQNGLSLNTICRTQPSKRRACAIVASLSKRSPLWMKSLCPAYVRVI